MSQDRKLFVLLRPHCVATLEGNVAALPHLHKCIENCAHCITTSGLLLYTAFPLLHTIQHTPSAKSKELALRSMELLLRDCPVAATQTQLLLDLLSALAPILALASADEETVALADRQCGEDALASAIDCLAAALTPPFPTFQEGFAPPPLPSTLPLPRPPIIQLLCSHTHAHLLAFVVSTLLDVSCPSPSAHIPRVPRQTRLGALYCIRAIVAQIDPSTAGTFFPGIASRLKRICCDSKAPRSVICTALHALSLLIAVTFRKGAGGETPQLDEIQALLLAVTVSPNAAPIPVPAPSRNEAEFKLHLEALLQSGRGLDHWVVGIADSDVIAYAGQLASLLAVDCLVSLPQCAATGLKLLALTEAHSPLRNGPRSVGNGSQELRARSDERLVTCLQRLSAHLNSPSSHSQLSVISEIRGHLRLLGNSRDSFMTLHSATIVDQLIKCCGVRLPQVEALARPQLRLAVLGSEGTVEARPAPATITGGLEFAVSLDRDVHHALTQLVTELGGLFGEVGWQVVLHGLQRSVEELRPPLIEYQVIVNAILGPSRVETPLALLSATADVAVTCLAQLMRSEQAELLAFSPSVARTLVLIGLDRLAQRCAKAEQSPSAASLRTRLLRDGLPLVLEAGAAATEREQIAAKACLGSLALLHNTDSPQALIAGNCDYVVDRVCIAVRSGEDYERALRVLETSVHTLGSSLPSHAPDIAQALVEMLDRHHAQHPPALPYEALTPPSSRVGPSPSLLGGGRMNSAALAPVAIGSREQKFGSSLLEAPASPSRVSDLLLVNADASDAVHNVRDPRQAALRGLMLRHRSHEELIARILEVLQQTVEGLTPSGTTSLSASRVKTGGEGLAPDIQQLFRDGLAQIMARSFMAEDGADPGGNSSSSEGEDKEQPGQEGGVPEGGAGGEGEAQKKQPPRQVTVGERVGGQVLEQSVRYGLSVAASVRGAALHAALAALRCIAAAGSEEETELLPSIHNVWPLIETSLLSSAHTPLAVRLQALSIILEIQAMAPLFVRQRVRKISESLCESLRVVCGQLRSETGSPSLFLSAHHPLPRVVSAVLSALASLTRDSPDALRPLVQRLTELCADLCVLGATVLSGPLDRVCRESAVVRAAVALVDAAIATDVEVVWVVLGRRAVRESQRRAEVVGTLVRKVETHGLSLVAQSDLTGLRD